MTFYHRKRFLDEFKMRFQKILIKDCRRFPIHRLDLTNTTERDRHDHIVGLVNQMLLLHQQLAATKTQHERTGIQR